MSGVTNWVPSDRKQTESSLAFYQLSDSRNSIEQQLNKNLSLFKPGNEKINLFAWLERFSTFPQAALWVGKVEGYFYTIIQKFDFGFGDEKIFKFAKLKLISSFRESPFPSKLKFSKGGLWQFLA